MISQDLKRDLVAEFTIQYPRLKEHVFALIMERGLDAAFRFCLAFVKAKES